jgi:hypothetical protein
MERIESSIEVRAEPEWVGRTRRYRGTFCVLVSGHDPTTGRTPETYVNEIEAISAARDLALRFT